MKLTQKEIHVLVEASFSPLEAILERECKRQAVETKLILLISTTGVIALFMYLALF